MNASKRLTVFALTVAKNMHTVKIKIQTFAIYWLYSGILDDFARIRANQLILCSKLSILKLIGQTFLRLLNS